jgi:hypothetical protein
MRLLSIETAAAVVGVSPTQLRLFLCREGRELVGVSVQGRQRPIPESALLPITLAFLLARDLGAPLSRACPLALELLQQESGPSGASTLVAPPPTELATSRTISLRVDLAALRAHLEASVAEQLSTAPNPPRRGRPTDQPGRAKR